MRWMAKVDDMVLSTFPDRQGEIHEKSISLGADLGEPVIVNCIVWGPISDLLDLSILLSFHCLFKPNMDQYIDIFMH